MARPAGFEPATLGLEGRCREIPWSGSDRRLWDLLRDANQPVAVEEAQVSRRGLFRSEFEKAGRLKRLQGGQGGGLVDVEQIGGFAGRVVLMWAWRSDPIPSLRTSRVRPMVPNWQDKSLTNGRPRRSSFSVPPASAAMLDELQRCKH